MTPGAAVRLGTVLLLYQVRPRDPGGLGFTLPPALPPRVGGPARWYRDDNFSAESYCKTVHTNITHHLQYPRTRGPFPV